MDFFSRQDQARRRTLLFLILFPVAIMVLMVSSVGLYLVGTVFSFQWIYVGTVDSPYSGRAYALVALLTLVVVAVGSIRRMRVLARGGGHQVAKEMGGRLIQGGTSHPKERQLLNVVEEMAIASSLPVPGVYILDGQEGINAFAAGLHPRQAVVAITAGGLQQLTRDELQGVIAHEFSHILQGDMRLNLIMMGILHGVQMISLTGHEMAERSFFGHMQKYPGAGDPVLNIIAGYLLWIAGYLGLYAAHVIKGAVSRQREYLADAAAVQFTRNTEGLAHALMKIGGFSLGAVVRHPKSEQASHLFFGNGLQQRTYFDWTDSHPPLEERIRRLLPTFSGEFPKLYGEDWIGLPASSKAAAAPVGKPTPLELATAYLAALPVDVVGDLHQEGVAVLCGLLLVNDKSAAAMQREIIRKAFGAEAVTRAESTATWLAGQGHGWRLPLVDMAIPALRTLPQSQINRLLQAITALSHADQRISLFEYILHQVLKRALLPDTFMTTNPTQWLHSYRKMEQECIDLLSIVATVGNSQDSEATTAFQSATAKIGLKTATMRPRGSCTLKLLDHALNRLTRLSPNFKKGLVDACCVCIVQDGRITHREGELLRVICDILECAIPPLSLPTGPGTDSQNMMPAGQ